MYHSHRHLVLFDIDGTLVLTGGAGLRAMNRACEHLVGHQCALDGVALAGRTDWIILDNALTNNGLALDPALLAELRRRYVEHLREEIELPGKGVKAVMPGIRELLEALAPRADMALGLLTGNFEEGARIKLEHFDLWKYFSCGAYGDDASDRNHLVPIAMERAKDCGLGDASPSQVFVIGDTPHDVACAHAAGATPIGVATGSYNVDQLRAAGAEIVFEDLSDTPAVVRVLEGVAS